MHAAQWDGNKKPTSHCMLQLQKHKPFAESLIGLEQDRSKQLQ